MWKRSDDCQTLGLEQRKPELCFLAGQLWNLATGDWQAFMLCCHITLFLLYWLPSTALPVFPAVPKKTSHPRASGGGSQASHQALLPEKGDHQGRIQGHPAQSCPQGKAIGMIEEGNEQKCDSREDRVLWKSLSFLSPSSPSAPF